MAMYSRKSLLFFTRSAHNWVAAEFGAIAKLAGQGENAIAGVVLHIPVTAQSAGDGHRGNLGERGNRAEGGFALGHVTDNGVWGLIAAGEGTERRARRRHPLAGLQSIQKGQMASSSAILGSRAPWDGG